MTTGPPVHRSNKSIRLCVCMCVRVCVNVVCWGPETISCFLLCSEKKGGLCLLLERNRTQMSKIPSEKSSKSSPGSPSGNNLQNQKHWLKF